MSDLEARTSTTNEPDPPTVWVRLVALGSILLLVLHFTATFLYLAPLNPVTVRTREPVHTYMTPLFQQNWQLFAPTPINEERGLLIRARIVDPETGVVTETEFYDFTSPLVDEIHRNRLFASRRSRMISNTLQVLGFRDPLAERVRNRNEDLRIADLEAGTDELQADPADPRHQPLPLTPAEEWAAFGALQVLRAVGFQVATERWGPNVESIQVRMAIHRFPRFSQREHHNEIGDLVVQDFEWLERIDEDTPR